MKTTQLRFTKEKETRNTIKFSEEPEEGKPPIIGSLYLQKWFCGDNEEVTVTIEEGPPGAG